MILPSTYLAALLLMIVSVFCLGSWANMQKLTVKWRFELFYYDFTLGLAICTAVAAFTLGSMNSQELTFSDNLLIAGYRNMAYCVIGGAVFNLANMLLVGAISVAGMSVAFPIAMGLALAIDTVWNYAFHPQSNSILLFGGVLLVVVAVVMDAFAYTMHVDAQLPPPNAPPQIDPRTKMVIPPPTGLRGIVLSLASGVLMSVFYPLVQAGKTTEAGVGPYGLPLLFSGGVLMTSLLYVPFFANFPVSGDPVELRKYFKGTRKQHFLGFFGGIVWAIGSIASYVAASAPPSVQVGPAAGYVLAQSATLLSALWGLLVWREFKGDNLRIQTLMVMMIVLFVTGVAMVSIAPQYGPK